MQPNNFNSQYVIPVRTADDDRKLGWLTEARQDGETYLKTQRSFRDIDRAIEIVAGDDEKIPKSMSSVSVNMLKRDIRENVATLANMRPLWEFKTDNSQFNPLTNILNKLELSWYMNTFADRSIRKALQYAGVCGLGWISPVWKSDFWCAGRGDIKLKTYGPRNVIPYQIGSDHEIQDAYMVTLKDEVPFAKACATYPLHIDKFVPDRSTPTWMKQGMRRLSRFLSPVLQRFGQGQGRETDDTNFPTVDIFTSYTLDLRYNDTGVEMQMGEAGTKWCYKVPYYGQEIATGVMDPTTNQITYRKAGLQECLLYPLRRMTVWTNQGIIYDDTSYWWHGKVPAVPFTVDDWPWDFGGISMIRDGASIQDSNNRLLRAIDDSANARIDPALQYDENVMSQATMERLNTRATGQRIKANLSMGDGVKPVLPSSYYDVPAWILQHVDGQWEKLHYLLGTRDIQAIAKARQVPAGDTLEKLMEMAGPILTDMSRNMERGMRDTGEMWKGLAMQFYDLPRRVQVLGSDGVTEEDFDYDPNTMIPSHMPDEMELIKQGKMAESAPSRVSIVTRAQAHINSCYFHVTPNSLHQITQLTKKLMYMQLWKAGFPIDPWTMAEVLDIQNFGSPDALAKILQTEKIPTDVFGKFLAWTELKQKMAPPPAQKGRPSSGQTPPTIQSKDGGARSTIRESPR
jgi:hypothetical protein